MGWLRLEGTSGRHLVHPNAQDHIQTLAEYLQGGQLHSLAGKPVPVLSHPHSGKGVFWCSDRASCVAWLLPCHWATLQRAHPAPNSLHPPFRYLYTLMRPVLSLLFSRLNIPSCLSFFSWVRCSSPFYTFYISLALGRCPVHLDVASPMLNRREKSHPLTPLATNISFFLTPSFSLISTHQMMYSAQPCRHWSLLLLNDKNYLIYQTYNQIFYCKSLPLDTLECESFET